MPGTKGVGAGNNQLPSVAQFKGVAQAANTTKDNYIVASGKGTIQSIGQRVWERRGRFGDANLVDKNQAALEKFKKALVREYDSALVEQVLTDRHGLRLVEASDRNNPSIKLFTTDHVQQIVRDLNMTLGAFRTAIARARPDDLITIDGLNQPVSNAVLPESDRPNPSENRLINLVLYNALDNEIDVETETLKSVFDRLHPDWKDGTPLSANLAERIINELRALSPTRKLRDFQDAMKPVSRHVLIKISESGNHVERTRFKKDGPIPESPAEHALANAAFKHTLRKHFDTEAVRQAFNQLKPDQRSHLTAFDAEKILTQLATRPQDILRLFTEEYESLKVDTKTQLLTIVPEKKVGELRQTDNEKVIKEFRRITDTHYGQGAFDRARASSETADRPDLNIDKRLPITHKKLKRVISLLEKERVDRLFKDTMAAQLEPFTRRPDARQGPLSFRNTIGTRQFSQPDPKQSIDSVEPLDDNNNKPKPQRRGS